MAKLKIRGNDLKKAGVTSGPLAGLAVAIAKKSFQGNEYDRFLSELTLVTKNPENFIQNQIWATYASKLVEYHTIEKAQKEIELNEEAAPYRIWGRQNIEDGAKKQMDIAAHLPITHSGALMADAHQGYGLPIGGVLAVENAVIPYGVGMDIGCRMCMSVFPIKASRFKEDSYMLKHIIKDNSRFGKNVFDNPDGNHEILQHHLFKEISTVKRLKDKAYKQLGSSGSGNHFVEFGITEIKEHDNELGLDPGQYLALLTHSGSRGFGANIASHYTKVAMARTKLPKYAQNLAWLSLDSEEGIEYWLAMNLAGDYASACHHDIHKRIAKALGEQPLKMVENHHNFAWKEKHEGKELIVHRKGATPASKNELGIIPGSMTEPGFIVKGKGEQMSLRSASHGAGRKLSRTKAKNSFTKKDLRQILGKAGVTLIGGGLDEAPGAYKDIHEVMANQVDLVDIVGTFYPRIVRMDKA